MKQGVPDTTSTVVNASPWTSALYVAASSLLLLYSMTIYLLQVIRSRRLYKASKPFPFNPAVVALVATATKIPSDVTRTPPGLFDHLLLLTGIFIFCITMNLILSSLARMDDVSNMVTLFIYLAVEMIYLYTNAGSVASPFRLEQSIFSAVMSLLFLVLVSHCIAVPTVRRRIENKFRHRSFIILGRWKPSEATKKFTFGELRANLKTFWWMAVTSNPDLALRGWGTPLVCAILTWGVVGLGFVSRIVTLVFREGRSWRAHMRSGNERLSGFVFLLHAASIMVGSAACISQGLYFNPVLSWYRRRRRLWPSGAETKVEEWLLHVDEHRCESLADWKRGPLPFQLRTKFSREVIRAVKSCTAEVLTMANQAIITCSNLVLMVSALVVLVPARLLSSHHATADLGDDPAYAWMKNYDIRLIRNEGEPLDISRWIRFHSRWVEIGTTRGAPHLLFLLKNYSSSRRLLYNKDAENHVRGEYPPHSWTLTVLSLAVVIEWNFRKHKLEDRELGEAISQMKRAVRECMTFTKVVDMTLGSKRNPKEMREAVAKIVDALGLNLESQFFLALFLDTMDVMLAAQSLVLDVEDQGGELTSGIIGAQLVQTPSSPIPGNRDPEKLEEEHKESKTATKEDPHREHRGTVTSIIELEAKKRVERLMGKSVTDRSPDLFVANCVYRVAEGLNSQAKKRASRGGRGGGGGKGSVIQLEAFLQYLADTMLACLTRLPTALLKYCSSSAFGMREERARAAAIYLGQAEGILELLRDRQEAQLEKKRRGEPPGEIELEELYRIHRNNWYMDPTFN